MNTAISHDTIELLRECSFGIKMGIESIDEILPYVSSGEFKEILTRCKEKHEHLCEDTDKLLREYRHSGKDPGAMAKSMSWLKTNVKLSLSDSDSTAASLVTDGCNMGVKLLRKYLNEYTKADEESKDIAKKLISIEEDAVIDVKKFL